MIIFIAEIQNAIAVLNAEESWHCSKVLRMKAGENVQLIDGAGNFYEGVLDVISDKQCKAKVTRGPTPQIPRNYYLHLAIAPTKNMDRLEWLLEKSVEIGVDEISLLKCQNSERTTVKIDRVKKIIESAVKQSLQAKIPVLHDLRPFKELMNSNAEQKLIAHCSTGEKKNIKEITFKKVHTLFLVGPEGDFSPNEISLAQQSGFMEVTLGENRLRTETAGIFVCQAASLLS